MAIRPHILRGVLAAALALSLAATGCSALPGLTLPTPRPIEPSIAPARDVAGSLPVARTFAFETRQVQLTVGVDQAVYAGSGSAQKSAVIFGKAPADWAADYYRAFANEPHQAAFYAGLRQALHEVRDSEHLDSDQYVELVDAMVQGLEYRTDPTSLTPKFPIETWGDGYGDCDDKGLLAAAILSQDGYDVSLLLFSPEKHLALGIRAPGLDYKGTGYAYVEDTAPSLVGIAPEELSGGIKLTSQPEVIRIGTGTKTYGAASHIGYIQRRLAEVEAAEKSTANEVRSRQSEADARQQSLAEEKAAVLAQVNSDPAAASSAVNAYNEHVREYNDRVAQLRALAERHNALVEVLQFVQNNGNARPQIEQRLRDAPV